MSKNPQTLKAAEADIYIIGDSQELICTALSLLRSLGKTPMALIGKNGEKQGNWMYGIPSLSPEAALAGKAAPIILVCSYGRAHIEKMMAWVKDIPVEEPVFWEPYDIERAYIEEKRGMIPSSKVEALIGTDVFPCGTLSRYMCCVERDYEPAIADIKRITSHVQAVKYLEIRTPSDLIDVEFIAFLKKACAIDNVFAVIVRTDPYHEISSDVLKELEQSVIKIAFYEYLGPENPVKENFEWLAGRVPFSYAEKMLCPPQAVGHKEAPLTLNYLKEIIARDLRVEIKGDSADDREICFAAVGGGLGNQILYYLLACMVSEHSNKLVIIDDTNNQMLSSCSADARESKLRFSYSNLKQDDVQKIIRAQSSQSVFCYNRLELYEIFPCELKLFSELFDAEIWDALLKKLGQYVTPDPLFSYLSALNCKMTYYSDRYAYNRSQINAKNHIAIDRYFTEPPKFETHFWLTAPAKNSYYSRIALTNFQLWNKKRREWAQMKLKFPPIEDEYNQKAAAQIAGSSSVVLHVRRGDMQLLHTGITPRPEDYYQAAIRAVTDLSGYPSKKYFIFSDEIAWCQTHKNELGLSSISDDAIVYIDQNAGKTSFRDMQLLSMGKIMIFPPVSSFSFCAFILSSTVEKYISYQNYKALCSANLPAEEIELRLIQDA